MRHEGFLKRVGALGVVALGCSVVPAGAAGGFAAGTTGAPQGWTCGSTGGGSPKWTVETDATPQGPRALLKQTGRGRFPWCVRNDASLADGWVQVRFKAVAGKEDQAGGVVWRWKDGDNYYVARANALENNVSLYYTEAGSRKTLKYVNAPVAVGAWHTLRVEFGGTRIAVWLDGVRHIEYEDDHIQGAGGVGVWTKADSVTAFTDFQYAAAPR